MTEEEATTSTGSSGPAARDRRVANTRPSWVANLERERYGDLIYLVRGKDDGRAAWHYVKIEPERERAFKVKLAMGSLDVSEYGEILHSGWGDDPPEDIVEQIRDMYG